MSKVLLVEDDINLREIYAARLSAEGHEMVVASDGEEALSKAVAEKPDLILLDVMMPKISGFDVLDILRSTEETKNTKVIMLSALSQQSDQERGEKLGADKYLIKSQITLEDVVETVKGMLGGSGSDEGTPIVTTGGRLPDENEDNDNEETATTNKQQPAAETPAAPATNDPSQQQASDAAPATADNTQAQDTNPQTPATPNTPTPNTNAANQQVPEEIDHIDNAMKQQDQSGGQSSNSA